MTDGPLFCAGSFKRIEIHCEVDECQHCGKPLHTEADILDQEQLMRARAKIDSDAEEWAALNREVKP